MKKRIAIDFDGVLIEWGTGDNIMGGKPKGGAAKAVKSLVDMGYYCYVLTARDKRHWLIIKEWLVKHKFPEMEVTNVKKKAVVYIDDRAIRFTNWQDIRRYYG